MNIRHAVRISASIGNRSCEFVNKTHRFEGILITITIVDIDRRYCCRLLYLVIGLSTAGLVLSLRGMLPHI